MKYLNLPLHAFSSPQEDRTYIMDSKNILICDCGKQAADIANEFVHTCNNYEILAESCKIVLELLPRYEERPMPVNGMNNIRTILTQALTKATQE